MSATQPESEAKATLTFLDRVRQTQRRSNPKRFATNKYGAGNRPKNVNSVDLFSD